MTITDKGPWKMFDWFSMEEVGNCDTQSEVHNRQHTRGLDAMSTKMVSNRCSVNKRNEVEKENDSVVFNLSSRILTKEETAVLSKGLKFVPTRNKVDVTKIHSDLAEWERRMRLSEYFYDKGEKEDYEIAP